MPATTIDIPGWRGNSWLVPGKLYMVGVKAGEDDTYTRCYVEMEDGKMITVSSGNVPELQQVASGFSGAYADLTGKPTLGTVASHAHTEYATAAQGALADTALQNAGAFDVAGDAAAAQAAAIAAAAVDATTKANAAQTASQPANANIQSHIASSHAPANAQKNSDITGAEIEAKLTGSITSHTHPGGGGGLTMTTVEKDLGNAQQSGTFDITGLSGLTAGRPVLIQQAAGPYTGKGTLEDEAEELVVATAYVLDTTTIRAYWNGVRSFISGNIKFNYSAA